MDEKIRSGGVVVDKRKLIGATSSATTTAMLAVVGATLIFLTSAAGLSNDREATTVVASGSPSSYVSPRVSNNASKPPQGEEQKPPVEEEKPPVEEEKPPVEEETPAVEEDKPPVEQDTTPTNPTNTTTPTSPNPTTSTSPEPTTSPSPSPPTIEFTGGTYWKNLHRSGVSYTVTANDAVDMEYGVYASNTDFSVSAGGGLSDVGSFTLADEGNEALAESSSWSVGYSVSYKLEGDEEWSSLSDETTVSPEVVEFEFEELTAAATGPDDARTVDVSFKFDASGDSRHTYNIWPDSIGIVWYSEDGGAYNELDSETLWPLDDEPCPAEVTSSGGTITVSYNPILDMRIEDGDFTIPDTATHFAIYFNMKGEATDSEDDTLPALTLYEPDYFESSPIEIRTVTLTPPEISYSSLSYWGEFNPISDDPGFRRIELEVTVTPNDAEDITVEATLSSELHSEKYEWSESWTGGSDEGTMILSDEATAAFWHSLDPDDEDKYWTVSLVIKGTLDGEPYTSDPVTVPASEVGAKFYRPLLEVGYKDGVVSLKVVPEQEDDPYAYTITGIGGVYVGWYNDDNNPVGSEETIYPGGELEIVEAGKSYNLTPDVMPTPPTGATQMMIRAVTASPYTGAATDKPDQTSHGAIEGFSDFIEVSSYIEPTFSTFDYEDYGDDGCDITFEITLNDALEHDGRAVLMYKGENYDDFMELSDEVLYYTYDSSDPQEIWAPMLLDDSMYLYPELGDRVGAIDWFKVRFYYQFPDGSEHYLDSYEYPVCMGDYIIEEGEDTLDDSGFQIAFQVDPALVDVSKIDVDDLYVYFDGEYAYLPTSCVSEIASDGSFTVSATPTQLENAFEEAGMLLDYGETYDLVVELDFHYTTDEGVAVNWYDYGYGTLNTVESSTSPTVTVDHAYAWTGTTADSTGGDGLGRLEIVVRTTADGIDPSNVTLEVTLESKDNSDENMSWSFEGDEALGEITIQAPIVSDFVYSGSGWSARAVLVYFDGMEDQSEEDEKDCTRFSASLGLTGELFSPYEETYGFNGTVTIVQDENDAAVYTASLGNDTLLYAWATEDNPTPWPTYSATTTFTASSVTSGGSVGVTVEGLHAPSGVLGLVIGLRSYTVSGELAGTSYTYVGGLSGRLDMDFTSGSSSSYLGSGVPQGHAEEPDHIYPNGFVVIYPLDTEVVPDASDSTISLVSAVLYDPDSRVIDLMEGGAYEAEVFESGGEKYFLFEYNPTEQIDYLTPGHNIFDIELSYTSGDGLVVGLTDTRSVGFSVQEEPSSTDEIFVSGIFAYVEDDHELSGWLYLDDTVDDSDLSELVLELREDGACIAEYSDDYYTYDSAENEYYLSVEGLVLDGEKTYTIMARAYYRDDSFLTYSDPFYVAYNASTVPFSHGFDAHDPDLSDSVFPNQVDVQIQFDYNEYSGYTYSVLVKDLTVVWTVDGVEQTPITMDSFSLDDEGDGVFTNADFIDFDFPAYADTLSFAISYTLEVSGSNGTDTVSQSFTKSGTLTIA